MHQRTMRIKAHSRWVYKFTLASDFRSVLARVRAGTEFVIECDANAVAVIRPVAPQVQRLSESLRDGDFGRDLEHVVSSHDQDPDRN